MQKYVSKYQTCLLISIHIVNIHPNALVEKQTYNLQDIGVKETVIKLK